MCPFLDEWIKMMQCVCVHTHTHTHTNTISHKKDEIL